MPLIISGSKDNTICLTNIKNGELLRMFTAHTEPITCLSVFNGYYSPESPSSNIYPFFVSGAEDNFLKVWTLPSLNNLSFAEKQPLSTFKTGHVKDVVIFFTPPSSNLTSSKAQEIISQKNIRPNTAQSTTKPVSMWNSKPIVVSCGLDYDIKLWVVYPDFSLIANEVDDFFPTTHFNSVAILDGDVPLIAAGGADGNIRIWSVRNQHSDDIASSYWLELVSTIPAHSDEIPSLSFYKGEGIETVLVSGSWDTTIKGFYCFFVEFV
jgi:WD40 repeat protein